MTSDDNQELDSDVKTDSSDLFEEEEFFDRERWHDVESEEDMSPDLASEDHGATFSAFSIAVLLLIAVIAGGAGIIAAYLIPILFAPEIPLRLRPDYRNTPALWIGYAENSVFFCDVNDPECFDASRDGRLFIGNAQPPSVSVFTKAGKPATTFLLDSTPQALAWSEPGQVFSGKLLVAHKDRIAVYALDGSLETSWYFPNEKTDVWSLAIADESVFAADSGNRVIYRFDEKGTKTVTFGQKSKTSQETGSDKNVSIPETPDAFGGFVVFKAPLSLTVSQKTGLLHIANPGLHRIETFTREGHWEPSLSWQNNSAGVTGFAGCCNPIGLDTLRDGRIVTSEKDTTRVKIYRRDGRLDCVVAGPEILGRKPLNVPQISELSPSSEDDKKSVFIAAFDNDEIVIFDPLWRIARLFSPNEDRTDSP